MHRSSKIMKYILRSVTFAVMLSMYLNNNVQAQAVPTETERIIIEESEETFIEKLSELLVSVEDQEITLWKKTDGEDLYIRISSDDFMYTICYEGRCTESYKEWTECLEDVSATEIVDAAFTAYFEVGGKNAENVQAQVQVLLNRVSSEDYPNTIREVVEQKGQYPTTAWLVKSRKLKGNGSETEQNDLEIVFKETLLVFAGETLDDIPSEVLYASRASLGSGTWKVINGTFYCY